MGQIEEVPVQRKRDPMLLQGTVNATDTEVVAVMGVVPVRLRPVACYAHVGEAAGGWTLVVKAGETTIANADLDTEDAGVVELTITDAVVDAGTAVSATLTPDGGDDLTGEPVALTLALTPSLIAA